MFDQSEVQPSYHGSQTETTTIFRKYASPTLFGIFFSLVLSYVFKSSDDGVYLHTRSDGQLFNLARLKALFYQSAHSPIQRALVCRRRCFPHTSWSPNIDVLQQAGVPSMYALLTQRHLRWMGHIYRMSDGRFPKDIMYG